MNRTITVIPADTNQPANISCGNAAGSRIRVAAYCRVSTALEEQLQSYENQCRYYSRTIKGNPDYDFAGIYADEGLSGTGTRKRAAFNKMIRDARAGKIDMIITKSISRFARNTLDCLNYVRELKNRGIGILFEKENIYTLDAKGEVLLTILSSLAQDESRSISENTAWGIRRHYETGHYRISTKRFLGYDNDADGHLAVNSEQAPAVRRIYREYLDGKTPAAIARLFESEGLTNWNGTSKWIPTTIDSILQNEKYKGDALLQKTYTVDFLTKKRSANEGRLRKYFISGDHAPIVDTEVWEAAQEERTRRKAYCAEHHIRAYASKTEKNPFSGHVICAENGRVLTPCGRDGDKREMRCPGSCPDNCTENCKKLRIREEILEEILEKVWADIVKTRNERLTNWQAQMNSENPLTRYRAKRFIELTEAGVEIQNIIPAVLDFVTVTKGGSITIQFLDGSTWRWG